jgi:hypothetical protein
MADLKQIAVVTGAAAVSGLARSGRSRGDCDRDRTFGQ